MKISKDSYSDYIESQLNKFAAFIAQSPSHSNRINHIEEVINHMQTKISQLQSNLKVQTICLNQHMNQMYRNKTHSEYIKQTSKGFLSRNDSPLSQQQRGIELIQMNDKYEDLSQRIIRVEQGLQNHISKSRRVSKQIKQKNNTKRSNQQCIQTFKDNLDLNERIEYICTNKCQQLISSVLNTQLQNFKCQFEQQKRLIKKSLNKRLQHFLSRVNETISDSYNSANRSNSMQLQSSNVIEQLRIHNKPNKVQIQSNKQLNKQNLNYNITNQLNQRNIKQLDTIKIKNNLKTRKQNGVVKEFKQQTERSKIQINPRIQRKLIKSRSKSISQLSNKSDFKQRKQIKHKRSKSKQNKQITMNQLKRQQSVNKIQKLKSNKNLKQLKKIINNKNDIDGTQYSIKHQKKSKRKSGQLSRSVSQSKIKSKIKTKLDSKPKKNKKDKQNKSISKSISLSKSTSKPKCQKKSIDLSHKSNSVSLLSIDSCSRSHSNISKISAKQKKNRQKTKISRESPPQFNSNSRINDKKKSLNTNRTNK